MEEFIVESSEDGELGRFPTEKEANDLFLTEVNRLQAVYNHTLHSMVYDENAEIMARADLSVKVTNKRTHKVHITLKHRKPQRVLRLPDRETMYKMVVKHSTSLYNGLPCYCTPGCNLNKESV